MINEQARKYNYTNTISGLFDLGINPEILKEKPKFYFTKESMDVINFQLLNILSEYFPGNIRKGFSKKMNFEFEENIVNHKNDMKQISKIYAKATDVSIELYKQFPANINDDELFSFELGLTASELNKISDYLETCISYITGNSELKNSCEDPGTIYATSYISAFGEKKPMSYTRLFLMKNTDEDSNYLAPDYFHPHLYNHSISRRIPDWLNQRDFSPYDNFIIGFGMLMLAKELNVDAICLHSHSKFFLPKESSKNNTILKIGYSDVLADTYARDAYLIGTDKHKYDEDCILELKK